MGSFADSVRANCEKIKQEVNKKCYSITWQLFTTIVYNTPVLKGELINSWYPQVGTGFSSQKTAVYNKRGSDSLSRINSTMGGTAFFGKDGSITMANNENYAYRAEMLGWTDLGGRTGPYRMVALSLAKVAADYK
jgi:hypothetical protein